METEENNMKDYIKIRAGDLQVTSRGVELTGNNAKLLAQLLSDKHRSAIGILQHLDPGLKPGDIKVDPDGRVIVRSGRIQKLAFESIRFGVNPANPKSLGRLIRKTGGRLGPLINHPDPRVDPHGHNRSVSCRDGPYHHETNLMCKDEKGLNVLCMVGDECVPDPDPHNDFNCFCGWGSG
jgi:hypothetical protein